MQFLLIFVSIWHFSLASDNESDLKKIRAYHRINDYLASSGDLKEGNVETIKKAGFQHMINLVPGNYLKEKAEVEAAGLTYLQIQVNFGNPTQEDLATFFQSMKENEGKKIYVHCQANLRASSFVFLHRVLNLHVSIDDARKDLLAVWRPTRAWHALITETLKKYKMESNYLNESDFVLAIRDRKIDDLMKSYKASDNAADKLFEEEQMNSIGYEFIRKDNAYAIKIFRLNTITYPDSLNVWDSLSEAYLASDKPEQAKEALYKLVDNFKSDQIWYKRMLGKIGEKKYIDYWNGVNYNKNKLSQYLGKYDSGMDNEFYIEITEKDGKLFVNTSGGLKDLEMKADSDTEFFSQQRPWQVRFADFKDGKAETMYMSFSQSRFNPMKRIH